MGEKRTEMLSFSDIVEPALCFVVCPAESIQSLRGPNRWVAALHHPTGPRLSWPADVRPEFGLYSHTELILDVTPRAVAQEWGSESMKRGQDTGRHNNEPVTGYSMISIFEEG